jgi:hypothetical protein
LIKVIGKKTDTTTIKLNGNKFYITEYLDNKKMVQPPKELTDFVPLKTFIQFDVKGKKITGKDGCNSFFGTIKSISKTSITFSSIGGTLMACSDLNNSDFKIRALLEKVTGYRINGPELELLQGSTVILKCVNWPLPPVFDR